MATNVEATPCVQPGQLVRIAIPGQERASASVTHVTATWIALRLVGPDSRAMRDFDGARGAVESIGPEGIHRLHGQVEQPGGPSSHALRFVLRSGPQFLGRREYIRSALTAPVVLTVLDTGEKLRGQSANVSEGGMLVEVHAGALPKEGTTVRFALAPRNSREAITGTASVTRAEAATGRMALEFQPLPREVADELARVVFEHHQGGGSGSRSTRRSSRRSTRG
ncbi:MAG: PilZ domain [Thermoleophilaceae bacterium]|jgi:hypothetical protein|nr:PilZ domain [Thermoleophilaceae bacterium]